MEILLLCIPIKEKTYLKKNYKTLTFSNTKLLVNPVTHLYPCNLNIFMFLKWNKNLSPKKTPIVWLKNQTKTPKYQKHIKKY